MKESKKKEKSKHSNRKFLMINLLMGVTIGILIAIIRIKNEKLGIEYVKLNVWVILIVLIFYLSLCLQIIVHEAGHYLFGRLSGYTLHIFRIGSIAFVKANDKVVVKRMKIPGTAGQCIMNPPDCKPEEIPFILYNIGGVLLNLIVSIISIALYFIIPNVIYLSEFLMTFGVCGIFTGIMNGIPIRTKLINNDGYNIKEMLSEQTARRAFWIQLKVTAAFMNNIPLTHMPEEWFAIDTDLKESSSLLTSLAIYNSQRFLYNMEFQKARERMHMLLEEATNMIGFQRNELMCELFFCEMILNEDVADINKLYTKELKKFIKMTLLSLSKQRLLYSYHLLVTKDSKLMEKHSTLFHKVAKKYPFQVEIDMERKLYDYVTNLSKEREMSEHIV